MQLSTASSVTLSMLIDGGETMSRLITFVLLMLIASPNCSQDWDSLSIGCCMSLIVFHCMSYQRNIIYEEHS